jgi:hypothetical protein
MVSLGINKAINNDLYDSHGEETGIDSLTSTIGRIRDFPF